MAIIVGCNSNSSDGSNVPQASAAPNATAQWQRYISNDKTFEMEFPSKPGPWKTEFESPDFGHTDVYYMSAEADGVMYGVSYNDYPKELSDAETDSELKNAHALPDTGAKGESCWADVICHRPLGCNALLTIEVGEQKKPPVLNESRGWWISRSLVLNVAVPAIPSWSDHAPGILFHLGGSIAVDASCSISCSSESSRF